MCLSNEEIEECTLQTLMHLMNGIGTGDMEILECNTELLISTRSMLDISNEVSIPKVVYDKADRNYAFTRAYRQHRIDVLCSILIKYLKLKKMETYNYSSPSREFYDYFKNTRLNHLQFHDFYLCEQGYMVAEDYLDQSDDYGYNEEGLIGLATIIAIHMFRHLTIRHDSIIDTGDLSQNPGGMFTFKKGLNLRTLIEEHIDDIEGIWLYEEDDEYDDEWEE